MSLQQVEDKYSALRALVQETSSVRSDTSDLSVTLNNQSADEFGEFMSAEQPPSTNPSDALDTESFSNIFADFDFKKTHHATATDNLTDLNLVSEVCESFSNMKFDDGIEAQSVESGGFGFRSHTRYSFFISFFAFVVFISFRN